MRCGRPAVIAEQEDAKKCGERHHCHDGNDAGAEPEDSAPDGL
jgi:hypothetical protein